MTRVVEERLRVELRKRAYEESKQRLRTEYEELQQVASSNQRREDRLARVRGKDFSKRLQDMERECGERKREAEEKKQRLQDARRESVVTLQSSVFPIQVEPLSQDDAGEDGVSSHTLILTCDALCSPQTTSCQQSLTVRLQWMWTMAGSSVESTGAPLRMPPSSLPLSLSTEITLLTSRPSTDAGLIFYLMCSQLYDLLPLV
ncbi:hypothetical protein GBAR_LOCUS8132 [Geodia barretti]|uniref:Uncharacterized protein n=1 Tax=Geodia barretti TaxID=519541 RepID=A0AA35WFN5_GEOBA|nr:hypothetical protein GBAR_LOCUS8132 [Geodia barretti]